MYPPSISCTLKLTTMIHGAACSNQAHNSQQLRLQVLNLYKTLLYYGRDYPLGYSYFRDRCHRAFTKNRHETDPQQIIKQIHRGEFIIKELEALYRLKKYRYLKQRYYPEKLDEEDIYQMSKSINPNSMLKKFSDSTSSNTSKQQQASSTTTSSASHQAQEGFKQ